MATLTLHFVTAESPRLCRVESVFGDVRCTSTSEGTGVALGGGGTFRWSKAVRALSVLAIRVVLSSRDETVAPRLLGGRGSSAAALDGALSKEPSWLRQMFGELNHGTPICRRLFARSNPGMKRVGPVAVSFSSRLNGELITILLDGVKVVEDGRLRRLLSEIGDGFLDDDSE